jgi:DNA-binding LacI/PurR family transcriptional regulator
VATVSRVFNIPDKVTSTTRERVEAVARALGYVPNASARTMLTQRSRVLGVMLPTLLNPVFAECLEGIACAATLAGYAIAPITTNYRLDLEERAAQQLLAGGVDGVILVVSNPSTSVALHKLAAAGVSHILAYNRHPAHPCVSVDSEGAVCDLVGALSVPQDLSVIGFDGIALGQDLTPMLSTIVQPNAEIGRCCVDLLVASFSGGAPLVPACSLTLTHVFREGESCAPPVRAP